MDAELQTFKDQLALVIIQLEADPENEDLLNLKSELDELIGLTEQAVAQTVPKPTPREKRQGPASAGKAGGSGSGGQTGAASSSGWHEHSEYRAGADCMAKYHRDGKWYPARINAVGGSQDSPMYTITFKGYTSSTTVPLSSLRPHDPNAPIPEPVERKRTHNDLSEREKEKKKAKGEKWMEKQHSRATEAKSKQNAWQKFGKKATKKGYHIAGLEGKSVFRTTENPYGRVGSGVNAGRGLTEYERMGKHKFERSQDD